MGDILRRVAANLVTSAILLVLSVVVPKKTSPVVSLSLFQLGVIVLVSVLATQAVFSVRASRRPQRKAEELLGLWNKLKDFVELDPASVTSRQEREFQRMRGRSLTLYYQVASCLYWTQIKTGCNSLISITIDGIEVRLRRVPLRDWIETERGREGRERMQHFDKIIAGLISDPAPGPASEIVQKKK